MRNTIGKGVCCFLAAMIWFARLAQPAAALEPIPDRLVVLTFDDSVKSQFTVARPLLKKYGFGATFFITEGFTFKTNKQDYLTWEEIRTLNEDGFEIGNHTRDHMAATAANVDKLAEQLAGIADRCRAMGIPNPTTFAWPGNAISREALPVLTKHGIELARRGGMPEFTRESGHGPAYEPGRDHPLLIPSAGIPRPGWTLNDLKTAVGKARHGRIAVLQFHGVPEGEHAWVDTPQKEFESFMKYLHDEDYQVIALKDLKRFVDPAKMPHDPWAVIDERVARRQN